MKTRDCILVVDDDPPFNEAIQGLLTREGFDSTSRSDPEEALEFFRANHETISLALVDLTMPKLSGIALSKLLFEIDPKVAVMIITGHLTVPHEVHTIPSVKSVLYKPIPKDELVAAIRPYTKRKERVQ